MQSMYSMQDKLCSSNVRRTHVSFHYTDYTLALLSYTDIVLLMWHLLHFSTSHLPYLYKRVIFFPVRVARVMSQTSLFSHLQSQQSESIYPPNDWHNFQFVTPIAVQTPRKFLSRNALSTSPRSEDRKYKLLQWS